MADTAAACSRVSSQRDSVSMICSARAATASWMNAATATPRSAAAYSILSARDSGKRALIRLLAGPIGRPRPILGVEDFAFTGIDWITYLHPASFSVPIMHQSNHSGIVEFALDLTRQSGSGVMDERDLAMPACHRMLGTAVRVGQVFKPSSPPGLNDGFSNGFLTKSPVDACHYGQPGKITDPSNPMKSNDSPPCKSFPAHPPSFCFQKPVAACL